jgi:hypothetical protein
MYQQKIFSLIMFMVGMSTFSYSQLNSDLGVVITPVYDNSIALEYRVPLLKHERYTLRYGVSFRSHRNYKGFQGQLTSINDTTLQERRLGDFNSTFALSFGTERRLKESPFSVFVDVHVGYRNEGLYYSRMNYYLEGGEWVQSTSTIYDPNTNPTMTGVTRHYLTTDIRFGLALNLPLGEKLLLHLNAGATFGVPFYLGETNKTGPAEEFTGVATTFNAYQQFSIGLRYKLKSSAI